MFDNVPVIVPFEFLKISEILGTSLFYTESSIGFRKTEWINSYKKLKMYDFESYFSPFFSNLCRTKRTDCNAKGWKFSSTVMIQITTTPNTIIIIIIVTITNHV